MRSALPYKWIFIVVLSGFFLYHYEIGYNETLGWSLTSQAEKEDFVPYTIQKGPFTFDITAGLYFIKQTFAAKEIEHSAGWTLFYSLFILIGISGFLAVITYWRRYIFLAFAVGFILFYNSLGLEQLGIFGVAPNSKYITIALLLLTVLPAYLFQAYYQKISFFVRWGLLLATHLVFFYICSSQTEEITTFLLGNATYGVAVFTVLYIFLIAEEIVFLILRIITAGKSGKDNEKHFLIFGLFYIGYLTLYYLEKSGIWLSGLAIFNPFYFFLISSLVAAYTIHHKQGLYESVSSIRLSILWLWVTMAIIAFGYFNLNFVRGNDAGYEAMHYIMIYAHLAFGFMFLAYVVLNFIGPLQQGLQVYKIAYKERNFPYSTARLGGLAAVAAFFFLANREPLELIVGAKLNLLSDHYEAIGEQAFSQQLRIESSQYAWDNHYAHYQLASAAENEGDRGEAYYHYFRASRRYPSPYAYINAARDIEAMKTPADAITLLREAETDFPGSGEIKNNLAIVLTKNGAFNEAVSVLRDASTSDGWNEATRTNKWWITLDTLDERSSEADSPDTRANILAKHLQVGRGIPFEPAMDEFDEEVNLYKVIYLMNANWYMPGFDTDSVTIRYAEQLSLAELKNDLKHSYAVSQLLAGKHIEGFRVFDDIQRSANSLEQGKYLNQMGIFSLYVGAPRLAEDFFRRARDANDENAIFNGLVALLESGRWQEAREYLSDYPQLQIPESILQVLDGKDDQSLIYLYYRWKDFTIDLLKSRMSQLNSQERNLIWSKINDYHASNLNAKNFKVYFSALQHILPEDAIAEYQRKLVEKTLPASFEEARQSAFKEWKVYNWLQQDTLSLEEKYDLLVEASEFNPFSAGLVKEYCRVALRMGFDDYAEYKLLTLYEFLPEEEYREFEREFDQLKAEQQQATEDWGF